MHPLLQSIAPLGMIFAVLIRRTDRRLVEELRAAGAVDGTHAATLTTRNGLKRWRLARLISGGAVHEVASGFFLDERGLAAYRSARRRRALVIVATLVTVLVVGRLAGVWHL